MDLLNKNRLVDKEGNLDFVLREAEAPFVRTLQGLDFFILSRFNTWTGIKAG